MVLRVFSRFALKPLRERDRDTPVWGALDSGYVLGLCFGLCAAWDVVYFDSVIWYDSLVRFMFSLCI